MAASPHRDPRRPAAQPGSPVEHPSISLAAHELQRRRVVASLLLCAQGDQPNHQRWT
jgi:hypothetical protein